MREQQEAIEDYEILNMIGRGGFARVYKARYKSTGEVVAVKIIDKTRMKSNGMVERVKKEVEIHSRLKHPSVLELYSFCEDSSFVYLILEMCSHGELYRYIEDCSEPLSEHQARSFMQQIVSGMKYLHTHGILHRDLSLTNLLLTSDLEVKIADFGLATQLTQPGEQHFTLCGTPNYISPEVASRTAHSLETDLWSLGCMFYTMLVGKPPFDTEGAHPTLKRVIIGEYEIPSRISENARNLIQSLLQRKPSDRLKLDEVLNHPFFADVKELQRTTSEDSAYCTIDSTAPPPGSSQSAMTGNSSRSEVTDSTQLASACNPQPLGTCQPSAGSTEERSYGGCVKTAVLKEDSNMKVTPARFKSCTDLTEKSSVPSSQQVTCSNNSKPVCCTPPVMDMKQVQRDRVERYLASFQHQTQSKQQQDRRTGHHLPHHQNQPKLQIVPQHQHEQPNQHWQHIHRHHQSVPKQPSPPRNRPQQLHSYSSGSSSLLSENSFLSNETDNSSTGATMGGVAASPSVENKEAGGDTHPETQLLGELDEPEFTSTPIIERPTKSLGCSGIRPVARPVVIAEFELTAGELKLAPCAATRKQPAAEIKETISRPILTVLEALQTRCKTFLERCERQCSPAKIKKKSSEMQGAIAVPPQGAVLSPISQNKVLQSAILSSPCPSSSSSKQSKDGTGLQAFTTERLRPIRQKTRNAIVNILDNGDVCLEFLRSRSPTACVTEILTISADGTQVTVYRPPKDTLIPVPGLSEAPIPTPPTANKYTVCTLPRKYWKKYLYAARFIRMVKSKTPKVTYFSDQAKCMLMESEEDFEAVFYSGPKFSICSHHVKVIDTTGMNISFDIESESSLLSAEVYTMWQHAKKCREHCTQLEKMLTSAERSSGCSDSSHFPVIIGSRWTASTLPQAYSDTSSTSGRLIDYDVQPPTMCSFDGSLMSNATTMNLPFMKPTRLSPDERHVILPPYQKNVSTSDESSHIILRKYINNIGWASQLRSGAVSVQFDDGHQLTVYSHKSEVTFINRTGIISRHTEREELPILVRSKLEMLVHIVAALSL